MSALPRISLCIVARNEAAFLGDAIESARAVVDDVIVVDTGSTDATVAIAREAGARVFEERWPGDMARAHDLPIAHSRADWILALDGDEVLDRAQAHRIPELAASGEAAGYRFTVRNYSYDVIDMWRRADPFDPLTRGALGWTPSRAVRLFERREGVRYLGRVHQSIVPGIAVRDIRDATVPIHHYGFLRFDRAKSSFYRALQEAEVADRPADARAWLDLGILLARANEPAAALRAFRRAHAFGERAAAAYFVGYVHQWTGRHRSAKRWLRRALAWRRPARARFDEADALERLALSCDALGEQRSAERAYRRAIASRPDSPVALNNLAELLVRRRAYREAGAILDRLLRDYRGLPLTWATVGVLHRARGDRAAAVQAFETALAVDPYCAPARAQLASLRGNAVTQARNGAVPRNRLRRLAVRAPIVSVISSLDGGSGRVLVDALRALRGWRHLVACFDDGRHNGLGYAADVVAEGGELQIFRSASAIRRMLRRVRPALVLHHWWSSKGWSAPPRGAGERWIAIGHGAPPMPEGYDAYVVLSAYHARVQGHLPGERVVRIPNGVDRRRIRARAQGARGLVTIVMVSRLDRGKFPARLLDFLPPLEQIGARLFIAGAGPRRFDIEPELERRGLARSVAFLGAVAAREIPRLLRSADIGLHLTETHEERCSMAVLEMMAAGLPIVAEPKGCLTEMIVSGENGFLARDERDIAARLAELVASPRLRRRMGSASRKRSAQWSFARYRAAMRKLVRGSIALPE